MTPGRQINPFNWIFFVALSCVFVRSLFQAQRVSTGCFPVPLSDILVRFTCLMLLSVDANDSVENRREWKGSSWDRHLCLGWSWRGEDMMNILENAQKKQTRAWRERKSHLHYDDGYESDCCLRKNKNLCTIERISFASKFCLAMVSWDKSFSSIEGGG